MRAVLCDICGHTMTDGKFYKLGVTERPVRGGEGAQTYPYPEKEACKQCVEGVYEWMQSMRSSKSR
jgi:hypothetical protein